MKKIILIATILFFAKANNSIAQEHTASLKYTLPADAKVREKLAAWQKVKFGLLMHWGTYSQWGVVESWSICPEDEGWTQRRGPYSADWYTYLKAYENLQTTFNPVKSSLDSNSRAQDFPSFLHSFNSKISQQLESNVYVPI